MTQEQNEAAQKWVDFLQEDKQQRRFMEKGFRPAEDRLRTDPASKITAEYGLNAVIGTEEYNPQNIDPSVAAAIDDSWEDVKKPSIVTFIVDTSGSMSRGKLDQAKDGIIGALGAMAKNNQFGLLSFGDTVRIESPVVPLGPNRFAIAEAAKALRAGGQTALYDAIKAGIEMTDATEGAPDAIRAIVVLTDGQANRGNLMMHDVIQMMSLKEATIASCTGRVDDDWCFDENQTPVAKTDVIGTGLALKTRYSIQIFFIGVGGDADMEIGRLLAEATGGEIALATEDNLAEVLEEFSKYF